MHTNLRALQDVSSCFLAVALASYHPLTRCLVVAAGLISFVFLKPTCRWLIKKGWAKQPFTAQENTVSQTFAMAMTGSSASSADDCTPRLCSTAHPKLCLKRLAMQASHVRPSARWLCLRSRMKVRSHCLRSRMKVGCQC